MLSDVTIRNYVEQGYLRISGSEGLKTAGDLSQHFQPDSLEIPTREIVDQFGRPASRDSNGWVLDVGNTYSVIPEFTLSTSPTLPNIWAPIHNINRGDGLLRPLRAPGEVVGARKFLLVHENKVIVSKEAIRVMYGAGLGCGNRDYFEEPNPVLNTARYMIEHALSRMGIPFDAEEKVYMEDHQIPKFLVSGALERVGFKLDPDENVCMEDQLRIKVIPFPRSRIQRRGIYLQYEQINFGDLLEPNPLEITATITPQFRTHIPFGYALTHVAFETNVGQFSYYAPHAQRLGKVSVSDADENTFTRFGLLLKADLNNILRARNTSQMMMLGEKNIPTEEFFEEVRINQLTSQDLFLIASKERISLDEQVVGFAAGRAMLALKRDRPRFENDDTYRLHGVTEGGLFNFFQIGGGPPSFNSTSVECAGRSTGIIDSGLKDSTLTTYCDSRDRHFEQSRILEWLTEGKVPLLYIGLEGLDRPVNVAYGKAGNTFAGAQSIGV